MSCRTKITHRARAVSTAQRHGVENVTVHATVHVDARVPQQFAEERKAGRPEGVRLHVRLRNVRVNEWKEMICEESGEGGIAQGWSQSQGGGKAFAVGLT